MSPSTPFRPVPSLPDFPALEHRVLDLWRERRTFSRLQAQNAGGPTWSFLDGPITANNPMGVHHAWGRTYKDLYQRFRAMLGYDQRWQNGFDCQGLWVEVNVERELGFTSKRDIEAYGIAEFVNLCKRRVLTYAAQMTEQSIRLGMWMDWNDPAELRRLRDLMAEDPARVTSVEGPQGPVTDSVEMLVGRLGMPDLGGSYFTFSNENNDLIWAFLAECHRRGWLYKGSDAMPWCTRCGTGISQMEMNEGYEDRDDPGLTVRLPLLDRPGEDLLIWTTTPWTLPANVAAAVRPDLAYVKVRHGEALHWLARSRVDASLEGPSEVLEELPGADLVGWRYAGPFDDLPAVGRAFAQGTRDDPEHAYEHRVVAWAEVGEEEGTGIVHIAPGCGAEDHQLGQSLGLPAIAPLSEDGRVVDGFGAFSGLDVREVEDPIVADLRASGRFQRLERITHRYPHCWRCGTALVFRLVDEWYISMGPVYEMPRDALTPEQIEASLRYQIMEAVDSITWIPGFGYDRELDWLRNMRDWMISKKRYWGLALPIYDCSGCGQVTVIGGRQELHERAVEGWATFEGHTPHRPWVDAVKIACPGCGAPVERIRDVGNPWLDAGIVPFSTLHFREDPDYWARWFPADFVTESFPGQFRNWFYSMLAMSTVLRRTAPFRTLFGYATLFGGDGRPMHKSWGNAIEFDEAAERMGVDVMRWMFAKARPDDNILFGWEASDVARRELLVLWNVFAFFVTYARVTGWRPEGAESGTTRELALDRWIRSRLAALAGEMRADLERFDAQTASDRLSAFIDDLSQWYLRRSRRRFHPSASTADRAAAFATLHSVLVALASLVAPILPFLAEEMYQVLVVEPGAAGAASVHLTRWPDETLAAEREPGLEAAMATLRRAVELGRTIRGQAGLKVRQPLARAWLALPGGMLSRDLAEEDATELVDLLAAELNVRAVELMGDDSAFVERRVRPLLPIVGKRLGARVPAVMAAAREGDFTILADGSVELAGETLRPGEVEIQAAARPGTAVGHLEGVVVVLDTTLTDELRADGDVRDLVRAIQDLRKQADLALDDRIELWLEVPAPAAQALKAQRASLVRDVLAMTVHLEDDGGPPTPTTGVTVHRADLPLSSGPASIALRRVEALD
jgi:isoleucyl-tRNA synthetase